MYLLWNIGTLFIILSLCSGSQTKGIVSLDSYTFDKILSKFKVSIVKFDVAYPYGEKHEEFVKLGSAYQSVDDLLIADVPVKDYGDKENEDLASRFGLSKEDLPSVKLFILGSSEPLTFTDQDFNLEKLQKFIAKYSKSVVYIGLPGTLEKFDHLATQFSKEKLTEKRKQLLLQAEQLWDITEGKQNQKSAEVYVKTMRKALEKGDTFFEIETVRVKNILKGSLAEEKKLDMSIRLNILESFSIPHDEL
ncbi:endoplasmic reticulum resident protein 29 [Daktulosphaira vitifoliae]|uniref:endoplasmic reticulum resident protein 29 n=1 Tax=Daktulosphaira vitifoliae TaxID=58002 RepID=UPI0021AA946E|nr:endoplasmic reticulum resident protein 29 [Daktulosphaira vitifoliae]